jgi:Tfp pilus assembly major pilin PilA
MLLILGVKGREWAWRNKRWESLEHFNRVQRKWSIWGLAIIGLALLGTFAAIVIPSYQDYTIRAKVAEGLTKVEPVKVAYLDSMMKNAEWPATMSDIGLKETDSSYGANIASVTIDPGNALLITFSQQEIAGNTLILIPAVEGDSLVWSCRIDTLPPRYAPAICRH